MWPLRQGSTQAGKCGWDGMGCNVMVRMLTLEWQAVWLGILL